MFIFHWPWLIFLLPVPFIVRYCVPPRHNTADVLPILRFPNLQQLKLAFPKSDQTSVSGNWLLLSILSFVWLFLVLAVMRPQVVDQFTHVQHEGYDLMLAVDISSSMRALDFSTRSKTLSRLDVTKDVVQQFVHDRQGDRIGLILFGENAYLQTPLTLDTFAVGEMLQNAVSGMAGDGTAIGDALGLAVKNLRDRPKGSRVIVLLTDGFDTASSLPPLEATRLAQQYGIRIYTIGIGKNGPVPYPTRGGTIMVEVPIDEKLLKEIASLTGGEYFHATDKQALQGIYAKINKLEKTTANVRTYLVRKPLYPYPLGIAAILLLVLCLAPLFRRRAYGA